MTSKGLVQQRQPYPLNYLLDYYLNRVFAYERYLAILSAGAGSEKAELAILSPEDLNERTENNGSKQWNQFWMRIGNRYFLEYKSLNLLGNRSRYLLLVLCGLLRVGEWAPDLKSQWIMKARPIILSGLKPRPTCNFSFVR